MHLFKLVISACALAAASLGCSVAVSPLEPPLVTTAPAGTLTVRWLVAGTTDPGLCARYGATTLELVVYDAGGGEVATANAACESFSLTLALPEGSYSADATLVDPGARARSVTKPIQAIDIVAGTDLAIDLDFPPSSIL